MHKNSLLFLIILTVVCFAISIGFVSANENISLNDNLTDIDHSEALNDTGMIMQSANQDKFNLSNNDAALKANSSAENEDSATINYLIKNKAKYDDIIKKSTKKDRTFKLGKYKLIISKTNYKKFLYAKFIDKYVKSGKNITLLEKVFKIKTYEYNRLIGSCVMYLAFPYHSVSKNTNKIITQKIGMIADYKSKKIYFKNYKKAKRFNKQLLYLHKIKYDKKHKKYYVKVNVPVYEKIKTKKAKVHIELTYFDNEYELTTYTKYDNDHPHISKSIVRDYTLYKSCKDLRKLNKSKTKKSYVY